MLDFKRSSVAFACLLPLAVQADAGSPRIIGGSAVTTPSWMVAMGK